MKLLTVFIFSIFLFSIGAYSQNPPKIETNSVNINSQEEPCTPSSEEREYLLTLDFKSFDQSLPDGGWRKYQQCPLLTRDLIDAYVARHESILQTQERNILVWHSGQISAMAGDYRDAIAKMERTLNSKNSSDAFLWNPYVKATIAFLKKNKTELMSERIKLALARSPFNRLNLRKVDAFVRCFESSYQEAYSGNCSPPETNIDRIKTLAIPFSLHKQFSNESFHLGDFLKMKKVILVGEVHGTSTVPKLFGNIVSSIAEEKSKTLVILEINQNSQQAIDTFLKTGNESLLKNDYFFTREYQDGRSSVAMVALLRKLSKLPNTTVLCMDPLTGNFDRISDQDRDTQMASFINSKRVGFDHTLVLTGNLHSSTNIGTPWDTNYHPMGYELKNRAHDLRDDELLNILVRYGKIDSWNCQTTDPSSCKVYDGQEVITDYSEAVPFKSYFIWENELVDGHNASIFLRSADVSFPFVFVI